MFNLIFNRFLCYFLTIAFLIFFAGCQSDNLQLDEKLVNNSSENLSENLSEDVVENSNINLEIDTSNFKDIVEECKSLCFNKREEYCLEKRILVFEDLTSTIGTCRSFSKYNSGFTKCKGYCSKYGHEQKCVLENGIVDVDCNGK